MILGSVLGGTVEPQCAVLVLADGAIRTANLTELHTRAAVAIDRCSSRKRTIEALLGG